MTRRQSVLKRQLGVLDFFIGMIRLDAPSVFLVHGKDEELVHTTRHVLEDLGASVTVLRELPNRGRTIIEKFESESSAQFAVVLLTPDDRGGLANEPFKNQKPRARQNVILELGFFLGKLGRKHVCALYRGELEIPTDYRGVAFVEVDSAGLWKLELARELKAASL